MTVKKSFNYLFIIMFSLASYIIHNRGLFFSKLIVQMGIVKSLKCLRNLKGTSKFILLKSALLS